MANLGTVNVIKADPTVAKLKRLDYITYKSLKFGSSITTAGLGSASDSSVGDQGTVIVPPITDPIQYWG